MKKQELPISIQSFSELRRRNFIYVDKTEYIHQLCSMGKAYFLSRPRRFGKSLFVSTLKELFEGNRELFKGLWIEDKWDWSQTSPVIYISFLEVSYEKRGLEAGLMGILHNHFTQNDLPIPQDDNLKTLFAKLIKALHDKHGKVVILIDEYDKAIIDYMEFDKLDQAKANQEVLGIFYGALKDADPYIRLLFITGISKFTKVSLFSKLNHLHDLTTHPRYATMLGYTQEELEHYFEAHITDTLTALPQYNRQTLLDNIRLWYDGYSWDGKTRVYNPFGTLLFFSQQDFKEFWFESGTPSFLIKKMLEQQYFHLEEIETDFYFLNQFSLDNIELTSLLFQTGYLTIKEKLENNGVILAYPNKEVREAMYSFLMTDMARPQTGGGVTVRHLRKAFIFNDLSKVQDILTTLFARITYDVYTHQKPAQVEGFFHGLIHILFNALGLEMASEVHTNRGRIDCLVQTPSHIYFLEFKINSTAAAALQQIKDRKYAAAFAADSREKVGIGINFNSVTKDLDDWETSTELL